jgi:hypothetical protein
MSFALLLLEKVAPNTFSTIETPNSRNTNHIKEFSAKKTLLNLFLKKLKRVYKDFCCAEYR